MKEYHVCVCDLSAADRRPKLALEFKAADDEAAIRLAPTLVAKFRAGWVGVPYVGPTTQVIVHKGVISECEYDCDIAWERSAVDGGRSFEGE